MFKTERTVNHQSCPFTKFSPPELQFFTGAAALFVQIPFWIYQYLTVSFKNLLNI